MIRAAKQKVFLFLLLVWIHATKALECNYNSDPKYFNCSQRGIFPNYNDNTCKTFHSCIQSSNGFYHSLQTCNKGTYFNRNTNKCDWYYQCPCAMKEGEQRVIKQNFNCVEDSTAAFDCTPDTPSGCYADPRNPYCEKYISCYVTASGKVYKHERTCARGTFFNASSNVCGCSVANGFKCPCQRK